MIEVWCTKAWNDLAMPRQKFAKNALHFMEHLRSQRTAMLLTFTVPLMVFTWHIIILVERPAHLDKIVAQLGSSAIDCFFQNPMPNNAGTCLLFIQSTERGYGFYFYKSGGNSQRKLLYEETYLTAGRPTETFLGWSPDDRFFAYVRRNYYWQIVICDGNTGATLATMQVPRPAISGAWLSPQTLAVFNVNNILCTIENSKGKWAPPKPFVSFLNKSYAFTDGLVKNLTAFDDNSVLWQQGNTVWYCGKNNEKPTIIFDSLTNTLMEFSYSKTVGTILLHCQNAKGHFFFNCYLGQDKILHDMKAINIHEYSPTNSTLINNGAGYAFMSQVGTSNVLVVKPDNRNSYCQYQWFDQIEGLAANQRQIFVTGSRNKSPPCIYDVDIATGSTTCMISKKDGDFYYWTNCVIEQSTLTNSFGEALNYYLYVPKHSTAKTKYPLIVGILGKGAVPGFEFAAQHEAFANDGFYFAYVDRYQRNDAQWGRDALALYENLVKRPDIDSNNVYLYGSSAGVETVYGLLKKKPELWQGAMIFSPPDFPEPSQLPHKRLFVDCGGNSPSFGREGPRIPLEFQDGAAKAGIPVTLLVHPGLGHSLRVPLAERERMHEALMFLNN
jgi:hypothetical protein